MLHSVAAQLEYLQVLGATVQRIILDELSHVFRPVQSDDERQVGSGFSWAAVSFRRVVMMMNE